jgi:hypothetical protein
MMGGKTPETCWAVNKRQDNKLKKLLHQVGDLFKLNVKLRCQKLKHRIFLIAFRKFTILYNRCVKQIGNFFEFFWGAFTAVLLKSLFFCDITPRHWLMPDISRQCGGLMFKGQNVPFMTRQQNVECESTSDSAKI